MDLQMGLVRGPAIMSVLLGSKITSYSGVRFVLFVDTLNKLPREFYLMPGGIAIVHVTYKGYTIPLNYEVPSSKHLTTVHTQLSLHDEVDEEGLAEQIRSVIGQAAHQHRPAFDAKTIYDLHSPELSRGIADRIFYLVQHHEELVREALESVITPPR